MGDDVQPEATRIGTTTYQPSSDEYVMYVHGWNMGGWDTDGWEKDRWTETVFKRLWWLGYKGRVGGFQWPTLGTISYDQSEFRAWKSGAALAKLLTQLNNEHPGQVRVIAHSMGNVVTGEAILEAPANVVHSYIATQAAIPSHMYDLSPEPFWSGPYNTPEIYYSYCISGQNPAKPYLADNQYKVASGRQFNYFNPDDWALARWKKNNTGFANDLFSKPDKNYSYHDKDGDINSYNWGADDYDKRDEFHYRYAQSSDSRLLLLPVDRFEIFAFCAQSRSNPLGAEPAPVSGFIPRDLQHTGLIPVFGDTHLGHSREFRSNLVNERGYWMWVGYDFELQGFKNPEEENGSAK
jgi:pimeloyl-ACP methyl ester carboxylesterase